jgi:hypothetical protein
MCHVVRFFLARCKLIRIFVTLDHCYHSTIMELHYIGYENYEIIDYL